MNYVKKKILIIENCRKTTNYLKECLGGTEAAIDCVISEDDAMAKLKTTKYDFVIMNKDVSPLLTGEQVIYRLKRIQPNIKIIVTLPSDDSSIYCMGAYDVVRMHNQHEEWRDLLDLTMGVPQTTGSAKL